MKMPKFIEKIVNYSEKLQKSSNVRALEPEHNFQQTTWGSDKKLFTPKGNGDVETLYKTVRASPECMACINAIVEDIMSDGWRFVGSKSAIAKAEKFEIQSNFIEVLTDAIIDMLITGNGYILKLAWNDEKRKSIVDQIVEKAGIMKQELSEAIDKVMPKDLQMVKSGTLQIKFSDTGVIENYVQTVNGQTKDFSTENIVHLRKGAMGGQPYGFTPLESMLSDIATLIFAKSYAGNFFENDGTPNWLFKMPDSNPDDRNYKLLKAELKEFKASGNKFRNMVLTGNIDPVQLEKWQKDMEFAKLIHHFTVLILMGWGVPAYRVNYIIETKSTDQQTGKIESGYYKNIAFTQKFIEAALNKYLWADFKVQMKFNRAYKIDEMREAQIIQLLSSTGILSMEEARERIGMEPDMKGEPLISVGDDKAINEREDKKRQEGVEERPTDNIDNKLKELAKSLEDTIEVTWDKFKRIVENLVGEGNFSRAKIIYRENDTHFILYFKDEHWTYSTRVSKQDVNPDEFRLTYVPNAIRIQ